MPCKLTSDALGIIHGPKGQSAAITFTSTDGPVIISGATYGGTALTPAGATLTLNPIQPGPQALDLVFGMPIKMTIDMVESCEAPNRLALLQFNPVDPGKHFTLEGA